MTTDGVQAVYLETHNWGNAAKFEDTHWGTKMMTVRDPDGRLWKIEGPGPR